MSNGHIEALKFIFLYWTQKCSFSLKLACKHAMPGCTYEIVSNFFTDLNVLFNNRFICNLEPNWIAL
jgi:hypothetical protein